MKSHLLLALLVVATTCVGCMDGARVKRDSKNDGHHPKLMMHSHLSRKVFDRACAASKDTIDEVIACLTSNEQVMKVVKPTVSGKCFHDAFGVEFDPADRDKHKDMICHNRDKFEQMTACVYKQTVEVMDNDQIDKLAEALVDVGLCIINALDG